MLNKIINGVTGYINYRGGAGHLAFVMHRVSGLGTLLFLSMHILLESTAHFAPPLYDKLNTGLRNPSISCRGNLFGIPRHLSRREWIKTSVVRLYIKFQSAKKVGRASVRVLACTFRHWLHRDHQRR